MKNIDFVQFCSNSHTLSEKNMCSMNSDNKIWEGTQGRIKKEQHKYEGVWNSWR